MKMSEANRLRILYFLVFCCTAAWLPIFADYLKGHGLSGIKIGLILAITPVLMFVIQPFYGMLADRLGYKKCLLLSSGLASISYALYLVDTSFTWIVFITVFMSVFYTPSNQSWIACRSDLHKTILNFRMAHFALQAPQAGPLRVL